MAQAYYVFETPIQKFTPADEKSLRYTMLFQLKRRHDSSNPTTEQQSTFLARSNWEDLIRYLVYAYITKNYYKPIDLLFIDAGSVLMHTDLSQQFSFLVLDSSFRISDDRLLRRISAPSFAAGVCPTVLAVVVVEVFRSIRWHWTGSAAATCSGVCRALPCVDERPQALAG